MAGADPFSEKQVELLLAAAARCSRRERAWLTLLIHTGFRASEVLRCRVLDVADGIRVRPFLRIERRRMKGGRGPHRRAVSARAVPLSAQALEALSDYLQERAAEGTLHADSPLFLSRTKSPLSIWRANRILKKLVIDAGFWGEGNYSTHSGRKAWAHRLYDVSGDILLVRDGLMHASVMTTERYLSRRYKQAFDVAKHLWSQPKGDESRSSPHTRDEAVLPGTDYLALNGAKELSA